MQSTSGVPKSLLSDVFEAMVAAIYLDGGMEPARTFVLRTMEDELIQAVKGHSIGNYKSALQHLAQRTQGIAPSYQLVGEKGPDHSKAFQIVAVLGKHRYTPAWGATRRMPNSALLETRSPKCKACHPHIQLWIAKAT